MCLDGFDGDACISDAEGAQDDIQVGVAAGSMTKNPPKWQKNDLVSGGHGQAGRLRGQ